MGLQPGQDVFAPSIQHLQAADPYQVSSSIHNFQANQVRRILEPHDQNYAVRNKPQIFLGKGSVISRFIKREDKTANALIEEQFLNN